MSSSGFEVRQIFISPRKIAGLALSLWLISLGLVALGGGDQEATGLYILLFGWLSLLMSNVAWFANIFFLIAMGWIIAGRPSHLCTLLAVLFSLNTWQLQKIALEEHGNSGALYGFGWGAVLWFLALTLLLAASGATAHQDEPGKASSLTLRTLGWLLTAVVLFGAVGLAVNDRSLANSSERKKLQNYAFKRTPVCQAEIGVVAQPIKSLNGPVELSATRIDALPYPFASIHSLLDWGIPAIQLAGIEYRLEQVGNDRLVVSWPATSQPGATLAVSKNVNGFQVTLQAADGRRVFDQIWRKGANGEICPDYSEYDEREPQPRGLVMAGLGLSDQTSVKFAAQIGIKEVEFTGQVIEAVEDGTPASAALNLRCPAIIGWVEADKRTSRPAGFRIGSKTYHLSRRDEKALCHAENVFVYQSYSSDNGQGIIVEKRQLIGFKPNWRTRVRLDTFLPANAWKRLQLVGVEGGADKIRLVLQSPDDGKRWVIEAKR